MKRRFVDSGLGRLQRLRLDSGRLAVRTLWMFPGLRKRVRNRWVEAMHRDISAETAHLGQVFFTQMEQTGPRVRFHLVFPLPADRDRPAPCSCAGERSRCGCGGACPPPV